MVHVLQEEYFAQGLMSMWMWADWDMYGVRVSEPSHVTD